MGMLLLLFIGLLQASSKSVPHTQGVFHIGHTPVKVINTFRKFNERVKTFANERFPVLDMVGDITADSVKVRVLGASTLEIITHVFIRPRGCVLLVLRILQEPIIIKDRLLADTARNVFVKVNGDYLVVLHKISYTI